jgi:hypothetical protein
VIWAEREPDPRDCLEPGDCPRAALTAPECRAALHHPNLTSAAAAAPGPIMQLSPEQIARIRQQYVDEVPVKDIKKANGIDAYTLYRCIDGQIPGLNLSPLPRRRAGPVRKLTRTDRARRTLVARLWRTANRQVREIERRLARGAEQQPSERDRAERTLAVLVKALRELNAHSDHDTAKQKDTGRDDDNAIPRDLDELRHELARRVDAIRQRRRDAAGAGGRQS